MDIWARRRVVGGGAVFLIVLFGAMQGVAADDFFSPLSPLLSPVINSLCNQVSCGKGNCTVSPGITLGYKCECDPGWTQLNISDELKFLPCIIPKCNINSSCFNSSSSPPAPAPLPSVPKNISLLEPCSWAYCGGGTCTKGSGLDYHCECEEGFSNLLNITRLPCYRNCSISADCANIGILPFTNSSKSPPGSSGPSDSSSLSGNNGNAVALGSISLYNLLQMLMLVSLIILEAI